MIVVVGTAHRVGSTWLCQLLSDCYGLRDGADRLPARYLSFGTVLLEPGIAEQLAKLRGRVLLKSHSCPISMAEVPCLHYVTILRDPRDVLVSNAFYLAKIPEDRGGWGEAFGALSIEGRLVRLINDGGFLLDRLEAWCRFPEAVATSYEGLTTAPQAELLRVGAGLELHSRREDAEEAVRRNAFRTVSGRERGCADARADMRKGIVGDWRNHFTCKVSEAFCQAKDGRWNALLLELGYESDSEWR